jgi:hypothetical protein
MAEDTLLLANRVGGGFRRRPPTPPDVRAPYHGGFR